mmetsp:Transcript_150045/g.262050  ORF Transcript_150045/g.262050 Transcript_150045/m.262050 type:complete len:270 (+) Transcript_150045:1312-2121(+)
MHPSPDDRVGQANGLVAGLRQQRAPRPGCHSGAPIPHRCGVAGIGRNQCHGVPGDEPRPDDRQLEPLRCIRGVWVQAVAVGARDEHWGEWTQPFPIHGVAHNEVARSRGLELDLDLPVLPPIRLVGDYVLLRHEAALCRIRVDAHVAVNGVGPGVHGHLALQQLPPARELDRWGAGRGRLPSERGEADGCWVKEGTNYDVLLPFDYWLAALVPLHVPQHNLQGHWLPRPCEAGEQLCRLEGLRGRGCAQGGGVADVPSEARAEGGCGRG